MSQLELAKARARIAAAQPKTTSGERARAARDGTLPPPSEDALKRAGAADRIAEDEMTLSGAGEVGGTVVSAVQGLPFVGEWVDEAFDAIEPGRGERVRNIQDAMERQRPGRSTAAQMAGGVVGSIPLAVGAAAAAPAAAIPASLAGKAAAGLGAGAVAGGVEGAVTGAGRNEEDRARGAALGGAIGAGVGGALGAATPLAAAGIKNLLQRMRSSDVGTIAQRFGLSRPAARVVRDALQNDDLNAAEAALRRVGDDAMLADAGLATAQQLDDAMSAGGEALRVGREAIEGRATQARPEVERALDAALGPADGIKANARSIAQRTSRARAVAYDRAYSTPIDYAGKGRKIEDVLSRVPPRTLMKGVQEANEAMQAAGVKNMQIMAEIAEDGSVTFREMPNVQQLDEIKKALGSIAAEEIDQFGRPTSQGRRARQLAGDLRDAVGEAVPTYRTAVRMGGDKIAEDNALAAGRKALTGSMTREDVSDIMGGASREAKDAFRRGMRSHIDDAMAAVQRTLTDPNTDAREAMVPIKALSSRKNREIVEGVLGKAQTDKMFKAIDKATAMLELRARAARNSQTAIRTAGREAMDAAVEPGAAGRLARGEPLGATKEIVQALTNTTPQADMARKRDMYAQISRALTQIRGQDAQAALADVRKALQGQPVAEARAREIANLISGSGALSTYQAGTQYLQR